MFGSLGPMEILLIFIIALLVFGPRKLPEIGRSVGKALREFKRTSDEIKGRIEDEIQASEIGDLRQDLRQAERGIRSAAKDIQETVTKSVEDTERVAAAVSEDPYAETKDMDKHDLPEEGPQNP